MRDRRAKHYDEGASIRPDRVTTSSASQRARHSSRLTNRNTTGVLETTSIDQALKTPSISIQGQNLEPTLVFDTLWTWLAERKAIDDKRRAGMSPPWTKDWILQKWKFCNAYRVLDRTSQFAITDVIEQGSQDPTEMLFRILLFNCFNRIETWTLLKDAFGGELAYAAFDLAKYDKVLTAALAHNTPLFTGAYIKIGKAFDYKQNHMHYLQQLQILMRDLPPILKTAKYAADVYEKIAAYPGMGTFTAFQLLLILLYSPLLKFSTNDFVMPGPGASSGLTKMFGQSLSRARTAVPDIETHILHWMVETQHAQFERLGLTFSFLPRADGTQHALDVTDLEHAVCEVDKYARKANPSIRGIGGRTEIRGSFTSQHPLPAMAALPQAWTEPERRVARIRPTPIKVERRWCIIKVLEERKTPPKRKAIHGDEREYRISWHGDYADTWEPRSSILEDAPVLVEEWEARTRTM